VVGLFAGVLLALSFLAPTAAQAHGVSVFAYAEGDTVVVEGYFHDGAKCKDCTVEAFDPLDHTIAEGKTDADGKFSFTAPARIDVLIRLSDPIGHLAEYQIPASDMPESLPAPPSEATPDQPQPSGKENVSPASEPSGSIAAGEVEQMVEKAVSRQLEPIRRAMEESQQRRRISDIIGGIGYIVGLMGLILYFRSKRQR